MSRIFLAAYERWAVAEARERRGARHARTRFGPRREGSPVDPGARDDLAGSERAERRDGLAREDGVSTQYRPMQQVPNVEGVCNGRQLRAHFGRSPVALPAQGHARLSCATPALGLSAPSARWAFDSDMKKFPNFSFKFKKFVWLVFQDARAVTD